MPRFALIPLLVLMCQAAIMAEENQQLDPAKPMDAIKIVNLVTADVQMTRRNAAAFQAALETLAKLAAAAEKAEGDKHPADKAPAEPAKPATDKKH